MAATRAAAPFRERVVVQRTADRYGTRFRCSWTCSACRLLRLGMTFDTGCAGRSGIRSDATDAQTVRGCFDLKGWL